MYGTTREYLKEIFEKKLNRVKLRGMGSAGLKKLDRITFGYSSNGFTSSNKSLLYHHLLITLDGQIYNQKISETNNQLHTTKSDIEALGVAYLEYGVDCVSLFNGAFAFAIYDSQKKTIFCARDRLGKKPFYYSVNNGFEFASQLSVIKTGREDISIDNESMRKYLLFGYIPEPNSIYKEIKKLAPGASLVYNVINNSFVTKTFWSVQNTRYASYPYSYEKAKVELHNLLDDAVKIRMLSDDNIGTFLSGGIDSTLMTALCHKYNNSMEAFSIGFPDSNMDESQDAKSIAKHLGIKHTIIDCNPKDGLELIENFITYYDEPFADSSAIPSMLLCKKVKSHVSVAISGDGGDESFIGYLRTKWINQVLFVYKLPQYLRSIFAMIIAQLPNYKIKLIAQGLRHNRIENLIMSLLSSQYFFSEEAILNLPAYCNLIQKDSIPLPQKQADLDLQFYLLNDCNVKMDRAAAYAGLEVRSPLLDFRVVEFARNLPIRYRYGKGIQKRIIKDILYDYVPKSLMDRPKSGFAIPLKDWFRNELKDYVYSILSDENLNKISFIDKSMVKKNISFHMNSKINFYAEIWKLIVLIHWLEENE
jgi:asparagine synthase (glutamine-hydrolysing)